MDGYIKTLQDRIIELERNVDKMTRLANETTVPNFDKHIEEFKKREAVWQQQKTQYVETVTSHEKRIADMLTAEAQLKTYTFTLSF
jgi:hypothetical protein